MLELLKSITMTRASQEYTPLFRWTITDGLQRLDIDLEPQTMNSQPTDVLKHIRAVSKPGLYVLLDFHPFIEDPVHVRLLKDICIQARMTHCQIVFISHAIKVLESARTPGPEPCRSDMGRYGAPRTQCGPARWCYYAQ